MVKYVLRFSKQNMKKIINHGMADSINDHADIGRHQISFLTITGWPDNEYR